MSYEHIQKVSQPQKLKAKLFPHQLASIYKMEEMEREKIINYDNKTIQTKLGINTDKTGYGKTLTVVGLLLRDKMEWDMETPYITESINTECGGLTIKREIERYDKFNSTLILVPPSIVKQWEGELGKSNLTYKSLTTKKIVDNVSINDYDVILTVPSVYNYILLNYSKYAWKRFVFDEPGNIRVSNMKSVVAGFTWLLTATPQAIVSTHQNCKHNFIKDIISSNWICFEEEFEKFIVKNSEDFLQASFSMPSTIHINYECHEPILKAVSSMVNSKIKNMIAANNIEGAIRELGGKSNNLITELKNSKEKYKIHLEKQIEYYTNVSPDNKKLSNLNSKLEIACENLKQLEQTDWASMQTCSICLDKVSNPVMENNCNNIFCGSCMLKWLSSKDSCPMCRSNVSVNNLVYTTKDNQPISPHMSKNEKILSLIQTDKKYLIFSAYDETFINLGKLFRTHSIKYTFLKGNINKRDNAINDYKVGDTNVIFLNTNYNGAGINLQETTDIIIYHELQNTTLNQIIGRANRIGRVIPLTVHYLYKI